MNENIKAFTFDDFILVPAYSEVEHDVDIRSYFHFWCLSVPIMSSPMDTITETRMMRAMYEAGGLGFHHRYCDMEDLVPAVTTPGGIAVSPSMGIDNIMKLYEDMDQYPVLIMDVAHGDTKKNLEFAHQLVRNGCIVISGNVVRPSAIEDYLNIGVHDFRVGIGSGSVCSTRVVTGVGFPQAAAIAEIRYAFPDHDEVRIISDGGHRNTGDICKALAIGADYVMLGGMLSGCEDVPKRGHKLYRGMASAEALGERKKEFFVEGVSTEVKPKGSVKSILDTIKDAIESACYYVGAKNLSELRKCEKIFITNNSILEGTPHGLK